MLKVSLSNQQSAHEINGRRLKEGVKAVMEGEGIKNAAVTVAVLDDAAIHQLNRRYLQHDYPTDVLTFPLSENPAHLEGDIVLSAEYAAREAQQFGWSAQDEMLLYTIHGALHLAGYDDRDPVDKSAMRDKERQYLAHFGLSPEYDDDAQ
jgi:probable rRNA maturation factor